MAIQTELHRHLDISMRMSTLHELSIRYGKTSSSTSLENFKNQILLRTPLPNLKTVLEKFSLIQDVLISKEDFERIAFETIEDCWNEGTKKVELRFSPGFATEKSRLSWDEALTSFEKGIQRGISKYPEMKAGLICIATRELGMESVEKTVEFTLNHSHRFLAFDLAGDESDFPNSLYRNALKPLKNKMKVTIHAGETGSVDSIWSAIEDLGARRIGHGIACIKDPKLMEFLREQEICLEVCPTSNWITGAVPDLKSHPALTILRSGIPVSINTDDPTLFGVTLRTELALCKEKLGFSKEDLDFCLSSAERFSFLVA